MHAILPFLFLTQNEVIERRSQTLAEPNFHFERRDYDKALNVTQQVHRAGGVDLETELALIELQWQCYMNLGRYELGLEFLASFSDAPRMQTPEILANFNLKRVTAFNLLEKSEKAVDIASAALVQVGISSHVRAYLSIELVLSMASLGAYNEAQTFLQIAEVDGAGDPRMPGKIAHAQAVLLNLQGESEAAIAWALYGLDLNVVQAGDPHDKIQLLLELANGYFIQDETEKAFEKLHEALAAALLDEDKAKVLTLLGELYESQDQVEWALEVWAEAIDLPNISLICKWHLFNNAIELLEEEEFLERQEAFVRRAYLEFSDVGSEFNSIVFFTSLINCLMKQEAFSRVVDELNIFEKVFPFEAESFEGTLTYLRSCAEQFLKIDQLMESKDYAGAEAMIKTALERKLALEDGYIGFTKRLIRVLHHQNKHEEAEAVVASAENSEVDELTAFIDQLNLNQ